MGCSASRELSMATWENKRMHSVILLVTTEGEIEEIKLTNGEVEVNMISCVLKRFWDT